MSGQCGKPSVRRTWRGGVRAERRQRVLALDAVLVEPVHARRADHHRAVALRAHEHEADARVVAQGGHQVRVALLELLERHAAGLARERDEPEAAGGHHDDSGSSPSTPRPARPRPGDLRRRRLRRACARDGARRRAVAAGGLGQRGAEEAERLVARVPSSSRASGRPRAATSCSSVSP